MRSRFGRGLAWRSGSGSVARGGLVLILFCNLANHTKNAADNVAHGHLTRLGRHQSPTNIADACDEGLGISGALSGYDAKEKLCRGKRTRSGVPDLSALQKRDEELD